MVRCSGGSVRVFEETRRSPTCISPSEGSRNPASSRSVVVLPQPEGPNRQTSCPWSIRKETSSTTASDPNRLVRPRKSTDANQCLPVLSHGSASGLGILIAFSSEVGTGSREENASKKDQSTKNPAAKRPSGAYTFTKPLDRGFSSALAMGNAERVQPDLDHAKRAQDHRRVDMAHMGDAERLTLQLADADAEHHAALFLAIAMQRDGIVTVHDHGRDGVGTFMRLRDIEAEHLALGPY